MERVYVQLARAHVDEAVDFSLVRTFNLDEYVGLAGDDPQSYRFYMDQHLFSKINVDRRNTYLPEWRCRRSSLLSASRTRRGSPVAVASTCNCSGSVSLGTLASTSRFLPCSPGRARKP